MTPRTILRNDKSIKEVFVVAIGENKRGPDVRLETDDARIDSAIYLTGSVPRAAQVEAVTKDSALRLRVHREEGQAVEITAKTTDSESALLPSPPLPRLGTFALVSGAGVDQVPRSPSPSA